MGSAERMRMVEVEAVCCSRNIFSLYVATKIYARKFSYMIHVMYIHVVHVYPYMYNIMLKYFIIITIITIYLYNEGTHFLLSFPFL